MATIPIPRRRDPLERRALLREHLSRRNAQRSLLSYAAAGGGPRLGGSLELTCECGRERCLERVEMPVGAYRGLRKRADQFLVVPGHEHPEAERIVVRTPTYLVVEPR